ncbi:MAG TPA: ABC-2 transporter permease [Bacilli bacterium]
MPNLLLKEWIVNRSTIITSMIILPLLSFLISNGHGQVPVYFAIILGCMYPFLSGMNEKNNSDILINSLPVERKEIVAAKYTSSILLGMILTIIVAAINSLVPMFADSRFFELVLSISAIGLFISIFYPMLYLLGPRFVMFGMIVFFACSFTIFPIVINMGLSNGFWGLANTYRQIPTIQLSMALLGITAIILVISWFISVNIYKRKTLNG